MRVTFPSTMQELKISHYLEEFLIAKEIEEGCAISTIKAYKYDLEKFINIIGDIQLDSPFIRQKIRLFLKKLKESHYTKKAIARKIATLRSFFKFLMRNEFIGKDPMNQIKTPKIILEEYLPKFLDLPDMERIFKILKNNKNYRSKKNERYYIIVRLLYATMARVSELCNIKIRDIKFNDGYIRLRGKGNKERIVPVDQKTLDILREYISNRISFNPEDFLLINTRGQRLKPRVVQEDIKTIKILCGFPETKMITPHIFRHTGATHLRRSGMDISELQDILGHSNPSTTRIYAKNDISKLKQSYKIMHPLNRELNM